MSAPRMLEHYILTREHEVVREPDLLTWARWFEHSEYRIVRQEPVGARWFVSTVFLGLDHGWGEGPPLVFESIVFKRDEQGKLDGRSYWMQRYTTWDEAEAGHAHMTAYLAACGRPPGDEQ